MYRHIIQSIIKLVKEIDIIKVLFNATEITYRKSANDTHCQK